MVRCKVRRVKERAKLAGRHNVKGKIEVAFVLPEMYGTEWVMYLREPSPNPDYVNYKLVAATRCERKANYWLSWKPAEQKFHPGNCFKKMAEHRIDMLVLLVEYMQMIA